MYIKEKYWLSHELDTICPNLMQLTKIMFHSLLPVVFVVWRSRKQSRRGVLLLGLCDSGKTLLFTRLLHEKFVLTHTSIKENVGDYVVNNRSLRIIDIPGHERQRAKFLDQYKPVARAIIFVVDSVSIQKEIRDVAEYLYTLLSDPVFSSNCPPFLILCNKQDVTMAKGIPVIKTLLEKEMNLLRKTKTSQLESTNETSNNNTFLGKQGKEFEFSHLAPIRVEFAEGFAQKQGDENTADLDQVEEWLAKVA
uniref:Signal recognition particle receptor subunit beta n=2 Tax=Timema TaxID=61471 RepID=A0A7R9EE47_9NEOP|nr:unnamed protein product [Timema cristinae]CAD7432339.1 unnamed protein product [Timema monikensis]